MTEKQENPKTLVAKLAQIMGEVAYVPKRGKNLFHKYDYAQEADIVSAIRGKLSAAGIVLVPDVVKYDVVKYETVASQDKKGASQHLVTLHVKFTFQDGIESVSFHAVGQGIDPGDKGAYKAITGAVKYALLKFFLIPTGDDPEADHKADTPEATDTFEDILPDSPGPAEEETTIEEKILSAAGRLTARLSGTPSGWIKAASLFVGKDEQEHWFDDPHKVNSPDDKARQRWLGKTLGVLRKKLEETEDK